jgi:hypothetical protein
MVGHLMPQRLINRFIFSVSSMVGIVEEMI